jgi:signal transduction histidine kinase
VRFDDSLKTVLAIDTGTPFGAVAAWRQLVDLIGRGRAPATGDAMRRLRDLRERVPVDIRAASARALAFASPGAELVALFAEEELAVAAPVLRTAVLTAEEWIALLPGLSSPLRSVLRHRRDLPDAVLRGLERFGPADFILPVDEAPLAGAVSAEPAAPQHAQAEPAVEPIIAPAPPRGILPFVAVGDVARELPVVAEARRHVDAAPAAGTAIADLVARIDAYTRTRAVPGEPTPQAVAPVTEPAAPPDRFRFETDIAGIIRWAEGVDRGPVIGISIAEGRGRPQVDGVAAGAFRQRTAFRQARLQISGVSPAAGSWRISGTPIFDPASGRFMGYRGTARRPRADESAAPRSAGADALRQLVHELRTPTNAIAGFAELIESELLGPAAAPYREWAAAIRTDAIGLADAIDDLDTAARVENGALQLRPVAVALAPLIDRTVDDLAPLARLRGARVTVAPIAAELAIDGDDRMLDRMFGRLFAAVVSSAGRGERIGVVTLTEPAGQVVVTIDRPSGLAALATEGLLSIDAEREADVAGGPLLGTGFALRLAQNLARELGGALAIEAERLTLRLPVVVSNRMDLVSSR